MINISFAPTMLSAITYSYHNGDFGVFRAFAHADLEAGNLFDAHNINYTWTMNGAPISAALYSDMLVNTGVYNDSGDIIALTDGATISKPKLFGAFGPVLRTPPLFESMDGDTFKCTAQHKKGGNIIEHEITISLEEEVVFDWAANTGRGDRIDLPFPEGPASPSRYFETSWRPTYWSRLGIAGEVCQYGRIVNNINDGLTEKLAGASCAGNRSFVDHPTLMTEFIINTIPELVDLDTKVINRSQQYVARGGVTNTYVDYAIPAVGVYPDMDYLATSRVEGATAAELATFLVPGHVDLVLPLTARVMHTLQTQIARIATAYAKDASSPGGLSAAFTAKEIVDVIAPAVAAIEVEYSDLLIYTEPFPLMEGTVISNMDKGYVLTKDKRSHLDLVSFAPPVNDSQLTILPGDRLQFGDSMNPTKLTSYLATIDVSLPDSTSINQTGTYGIHRLRGESDVTIIRPAGTLLYTDPETTNGTLLKPTHFEGIQAALNSLHTVKTLNTQPNTSLDCTFGRIFWKYDASANHGVYEYIDRVTCDAGPTPVLNNQGVSTVTGFDLIPNVPASTATFDLDFTLVESSVRTERILAPDNYEGICICSNDPYDYLQSSPPGCGDDFDISVEVTTLGVAYNASDASMPYDPYCDNLDPELGMPTPVILPCAPTPTYSVGDENGAGISVEMDWIFTRGTRGIAGESGVTPTIITPKTFNIDFSITVTPDRSRTTDLISSTFTLNGPQWECEIDNFEAVGSQVDVDVYAVRGIAPRLPFGYSAKIIAGGRNVPYLGDKVTHISPQEALHSRGAWTNLNALTLLKTQTIRKDIPIAFPTKTAVYSGPGFEITYNSHDFVNIPLDTIMHPAGGGVELAFMPEKTTDMQALGFYYGSHRVTEDTGIYYESALADGSEPSMDNWGDYWYGGAGAIRPADDLYLQEQDPITEVYAVDFQTLVSSELNFNYFTNGGRLFSMLYCEA